VQCVSGRACSSICRDKTSRFSAINFVWSESVPQVFPRESNKPCPEALHTRGHEFGSGSDLNKATRIIQSIPAAPRNGMTIDARGAASAYLSPKWKMVCDGMDMRMEIEAIAMALHSEDEDGWPDESVATSWNICLSACQADLQSRPSSRRWYANIGRRSLGMTDSDWS
jgi:hypothetical protein